MITQDYLQAVKALKDAITHSRYRAIQHVNKEVLYLNYAIGRFISINSRSAKWGSNAIKIISELLQKEMPGLRGYSEANIKMMRIFYESWQDVFENRQLTTDEMDNHIIVSELQIRQMPSDEFTEMDLEMFLKVSFSNHYAILSKTTTIKERMFYVRRCATEFWSYLTTQYHLNENLYEKEGKIHQTNFEKTLVEPKFKQKALQSFKDEYMMDFVNVADNEDVDERLIENEIIRNIKNFIMAFGSDFAYIGNQFRIEVAGKEYFVDLLFYSRRLRSLVAFELKRGEFKPEYTGKLNFYLAALDKYVKLPDENPSIGVILCKSKEEEIVELSFSDTSKPMGVATYRTSKELPARLREALPDMEDLKKLM